VPRVVEAPVLVKLAPPSTGEHRGRLKEVWADKKCRNSALDAWMARAKARYAIEVVVTCSPRTGPSDMRVILAREGRRTFDEAHPPLARADHPQAP